MTSGTDISALYHEFTDALTEILAENAVGPARRGRLARTRAAVKKHAPRHRSRFAHERSSPVSYAATRKQILNDIESTLVTASFRAAIACAASTAFATIRTMSRCC